jgi:hypothetical protein
MRLICSGAGLLALAFAAACGGGPAPETAGQAPAITAPADAAEAPLQLSPVCQNLERLVAARGDSPAFASLPDDFAFRDGVACAAADQTIKAGADQTPITLSGYTCVFKQEPGATEDAAWPVWQGVMADASECGANGWIMLTNTDVSADAPTRSILLFRDAGAPRLVLPEGATEPVRFEWSQDGGQTILLFVAAP